MQNNLNFENLFKIHMSIISKNLKKQKHFYEILKELIF